MDTSEFLTVGFWIMPLWGLVVLWCLQRKGLLSPRSLAMSPPRDVGLGVIDLLMGFLLLTLCSAAWNYVIHRWAPHKLFSGTTVGRYALEVLLGQAMLLPVVLYVLWRVTRRSGGLIRFGGLPRQGMWREIWLGCLGLLVALSLVLAAGAVVATLSAWLVEPPPVVAHDMLQVMMESDSLPAILAMLFSAVLMAPLIEEILYRGLVQTALLELDWRNQRWPVVLVASCWFTLVHQGAVPWQGLPGLFVLALVLGWLYERYGSLWPCVIVHGGFNAFNAAWTLLIPTMTPS